MKTPIVTVFLLALTGLYGQTVDISILKFKDEYRGHEPGWQACNQDSAFYKSDTVIFTTQFYGCCDYFSMTIRNKNVHRIYTGQSCIEPPSKTLTTKIKTGRIKSRGSSYFLVIYEDGWEIKEFKIIELTTKKYVDNEGYPRSYYAMTLVAE